MRVNQSAFPANTYQTNRVATKQTPQASAASTSTAAADSVELSTQAHTFSFPPADAPEDVKKAYDNLSPHDKFVMSTTAFGMSLKANIHRDAYGHVTRNMPGDAGYVDIYNQPNLTVGGFLNQMKSFVTEEASIGGNTPDRAHALDTIDALMTALGQSGTSEALVGKSS